MELAKIIFVIAIGTLVFGGFAFYQIYNHFRDKKDMKNKDLKK